MADLNLTQVTGGLKIVSDTSSFVVNEYSTKRNNINVDEISIVSDIKDNYAEFDINFNDWDNVLYNGSVVADASALESTLQSVSSGSSPGYMPAFNTNIALGKINGATAISKFGENPDVDTGTVPEDIWGFGGEYIFSTTAAIDTISSSNALDTQEIVIVGQDIDYVEVIQTATLNGQNKVVLTTPLFRVYRVYNNNSVDFSGNIYIYEDTTITGGIPDDSLKVRAYIANGANQSEMMIYTVPAGKTLVYSEGFIALSRGQAGSADFTLRSRLVGKVFRVKRRIALNSQGTGTWRAVYSVDRVIPEKTDIVFRCENVSANNTGVSGGFEGFLLDNTIWGL